MSALKDTVLETILPMVQSPAQYVGGEYNAVVKSAAEIDVTMALAFPDAYTIGMSNLGMRILYDIVNQREDALAERVFAPWPDMAAALRAHDLPLYTLESFRPLHAYDIVGFSVSTELCYSNILAMLDLGGIPLRAADRGDEVPLIAAGGHNSNYEPVADFFDFVFIGEGEEAIGEILDAVKAGKGLPREERLDLLEPIEGVYIPARFEIVYQADGTIAAIDPKGAKQIIRRRIVADLDQAPFPLRPLVPNIEVVHDRISVELMRGCPNACRYCMSGNYSRRVRLRKPETVMALCKSLYVATGYDEIGLLSLSSGDYPGIMDLVRDISAYFSPRHVGISLPSLSITRRVLDLMPELKAVRKSGLTFAPETASEELRALQNKNMKNDELFDIIAAAYQSGWEHIKLYFMVGLPGETPEDAAAIGDFVHTVSQLRKEVKGRPGRVNLTVSPFIPKPFTPFQREGMLPRDAIEARIRMVTDKISRKAIRYKYADADITYLEGVFARGDRRLSAVIEEAWRQGAGFDRWDEHFNNETWMRAMQSADLDPEFYTTRVRGRDEILPWSHIHTGCEEYVNEQYDAFVEQAQRRTADAAQS